MAEGGIQSVQSSPRSDYGGGSVGGGILSGAKKKRSGTGGSSGSPKDELGDPPAMKRGGKVRKGGMILMHKGERVLTAKQEKKRAKGTKGAKGRKKGRGASKSRG